MSEIAFNISGEPFDPPPATAAWRVRKLKSKGAPEVVYGRDGLPLFLPLDADIEELRREVMPPSDGRYRLDPVDEHNRPLPGAQASYVCVHPVEHAPEPAAPTAAAAEIQADTTAQLVNALLESQKQHTELARMYVAQFPVLVNALSGVVRSAGDAGLPARVPLVVPVAPEVKPPEPPGGDKDDADEDDDQEEGEDDEEVEIIEAAPAPEWNWPRFATAALDKFSPAIDALVGQLPTLGAVLGARRAKRPASEPTQPTSAAPAPDIATHLNAIRAALSPEEATTAMALVDELPMTEKLAYVQKVRQMSVPEAVAYVRSELARRARNSAHGAAAQEADEETGPGTEMSNAEFDAHVAAICAAMTDAECKTVRGMLEELADEHRLIWAQKLYRMSAPEGAAFLRSQLAEAQRGTRAGGVVDPRIVHSASAAPSSASRPAAPRDPAPRPSAPVKPRRDGRRAAGLTAPLESSSATSTAPTGGAPSSELGMMPTAQAHIDAIQRALTPEENATVRAHLATLPLAERSAWIEALLALPVAEAIVAIRAQQLADRASAAPAADLIETATAQPSKHATSAAEAVPVASAEIASIGAEQTAPSSRPMPASTTPPPASADVVAPPDEQPAPALAIDAPAGAVPTVPAAALPTADAPSLDAPPSAAPEAAETNADAHLLAIELALTAGERFLVHTTVAQMDPETRELLLDQLLSASVPEGAGILRAAIQGRTTEAPPAETRPQAAALAGAPGPDVRQRLDDGETLDTGEEIDTEELGDARELELEELDEEDHPDDGQPNHEPATDGQALADADTAAIAPTAVPSAGLPTLDPEAYRHFMAINAVLTFAERMRMFELGARLSPAELRAWIAALTPLSVPEAIAKVRAALAMADASAANGNAHAAKKKGGVS